MATRVDVQETDDLGNFADAMQVYRAAVLDLLRLTSIEFHAILDRLEDRRRTMEREVVRCQAEVYEAQQALRRCQQLAQREADWACEQQRRAAQAAENALQQAYQTLHSLLASLRSAQDAWQDCEPYLWKLHDFVESDFSRAQSTLAARFNILSQEYLASTGGDGKALG